MRPAFLRSVAQPFVPPRPPQIYVLPARARGIPGAVGPAIGVALPALPYNPAANDLPGVSPAGQVSTGTGLDPVLNQVVATFAQTAGPIVRDEILPVIQQDRAMQQVIGAAAGHAIYDDSKTVIWTVGAFICLAAGAVAYRAIKGAR